MSRAGATRGWLAYSLAVALAAFAFLAAYAPSPWPIQPHRAELLAAALEAQTHGAPPLVGDAALVPEGLRAAEPVAHGYLALAPGDDPGIYVYAPLVAHAGGSNDPLDGVRWLYALLFALTAGSYPLVFRALFRSRAAALIAPWALLAGLVGVIGFHDIYWILAWPVLTLLPLLMLLARRWPRQGLAVAVTVMLAASFASSIRAGAGLPVLLAGFAVVLLQPWQARRRAAVCACMFVSYLAVAPLAVSALDQIRDGWLGVGPSSADHGHGTWHSAYIGLGYMPNSYGLHYRDIDGVRAAERARPGVRFHSGAYESTMRGLYFSMVRRHPGFVVRTLADKTLVILGGSRRLALAALLALLSALVMCLFARTRRVLQRYVLLVLPAVVLGLAPAIVVAPNRAYASGFLGALLLMLLLAMGYVLSILPARDGVLSELFAVRPSWETLSRRGRSAVGAAAAIGALIVFTAVVGPSVQARADAWAALPSMAVAR